MRCLAMLLCLHPHWRLVRRRILWKTMIRSPPPSLTASSLESSPPLVTSSPTTRLPGRHQRSGLLRPRHNHHQLLELLLSLCNHHLPSQRQWGVSHSLQRQLGSLHLLRWPRRHSLRHPRLPPQPQLHRPPQHPPQALPPSRLRRVLPPRPVLVTGWRPNRSLHQQARRHKTCQRRCQRPQSMPRLVRHRHLH